MEEQKLQGVRGWLVVYCIGSIPLLAVYSMGLSGWFFEYPLGLMVAIFVVLAFPLVLVLAKSPRAPRWNIAVLWSAAALMALRSVSVFVEDGGRMGGAEMLAVAQPLVVIVSAALWWAIVWTQYFKKSARVKNTFYRA